MKLNFRQRLLATTLLVGAGTVASPAFAQNPATPPECPPGTPAGTAGCSPPDTATGSQPETTTPVEGQTAVPSTSATGETVRAPQDIVITGTRIPQPNLTSASPVTVISSQEVKLQGTTRTEDLINSLPQSFASQGSNVSNGATGTATVNLRGLGPTRTMVLVNGRRLMPGDPAFPVADINFIPAAMIKRVDVLTGGASSVYGADAVAGVVNFIMDTNFRGLRVDAQASTYMHDNRAGAKILGPNADLGYRPPHGLSTNGGAQDIAAAFGAGFDDNRGSIMAYATYRKQDAVLEASRDYAFCALGANSAEDAAEAGPFYCGGSGTSAQGRIRVFDPVDGTKLFDGHVEGNQLLPGVPLFNFAPYNFFQRPDERYTFGAFADYEISPGAKPYLEAMFMNDRSDAVIAPSGNFGNTTYVNCDNPLLSAQQLALICQPGHTFTNPALVNPATGLPSELASVLINRRNVEGGGRDADLEHTAWRVVAGIRGELLKGVSYDAYYQFGTTRFAQTFLNDFSVTRLQRATDVVTDPDSGLPVCRSVLTGQDPLCVPYNVFQTGAVTQAALDYLQTPGFQRGDAKETIADANLTIDGGEYGIQTPWSDRGFGLNVGGEYRKESLDFQVDQEFASGDLAGQGGPTLPVSGGFDVREAFAELQLPIVNHSFIEELTVGAGYRYSDYKVNDHHFSTDTYKLSLELAPVRDIRARASYNRAVRAPNIVELFGPASLGLAGGTDFCAGATPIFTPAQCALTGVSAAQYGNVDTNPANQYNARFSGNVNLLPEKADTYTVGLVVQPRWVPGLAFTVDYFDIKVKNLISGLPFNGVLASCALSGDPAFCDLIQRDITGSLTNLPTGFIALQTRNVGGLRTKGIDLNASYSRRIGGMGTLNVSFVGTWLKKLEFDTGISPGVLGMDGVYDCVGFFGATCTSGAPFTSPNMKWRHKLRAGFTLPMGLGISGQWRHFSSVRNDSLSEDADLNFAQGPHSAPGNAKLNAQNYFDLSLTARLADRYNFRMGANNIFDKSPPVAAGDVVGPPSGNGNTFPQMYDALGRFVFAGVTVDF
ncbi:MAG: TonB-dependent receptor domain-containing protein [Sphingomicrobium sp.]